MDAEDLRTLLRAVEPVDGDLPPWIADLNEDELGLAARWIRTRLDRITHRGAAAKLVNRLTVYRDREGAMLRPLFDAAVVAVGAADSPEQIAGWTVLVEQAERAVAGLAQVRAWIAVLEAIAAGTQAEVAVSAGPAAVVSTSVPLAQGAPPAPRPQTMEDRVRSMVRAASPHIHESLNVSSHWGIDFGTARSKVVLRASNGSVEEGAATTRSLPSVVVVERDGDGMLFGQQAMEVRGDGGRWNVCTSMKRYLVGQRIDVAGMPTEMTTERLTILYIAWLVHAAHRDATLVDSPCDLHVNLSVPLARSGDVPQLRDVFSVGYMDRRLAYRDWLPRAFRLAQLIASTYRDSGWPTSVSELLYALRTWDQMEWPVLQRTTGIISEPAAVAGDFEPLNLPAGLSMLIDCGAGTTDVSIFWRRDDRLFRIVEHSAVVGGDVIDAAIEGAVLKKRPSLLPYRSHIMNWAREAKLTLLSGGSVDFDPVTELDLDGQVAVGVTLADAAAGVGELAIGVSAVVDAALVAASSALIDAQPRGETKWPSVENMASVSYLGGSSGVNDVPRAIEKTLRKHGITCGALPLVPPNQYAGWNPERYRLMACAAGASRRELLRPEDLPPDRFRLNNPNSPFDKD